MSENTTTETAETVETIEATIEGLLEIAFEGNETVTPYRIAILINGAFEVLGSDKRIPTQYMYNYDRNGMIVKGKKGAKAYTVDEVRAFMTKYVNKHTK